MDGVAPPIPTVELEAEGGSAMVKGLLQRYDVTIPSLWRSLRREPGVSREGRVGVSVECSLLQVVAGLATGRSPAGVGAP